MLHMVKIRFFYYNDPPDVELPDVDDPEVDDPEVDEPDAEIASYSIIVEVLTTVGVPVKASLSES